MKSSLHTVVPDAVGLKTNRDIRTSTLSNGLTVMTDRMDHLESASLGVWVRAGSRDERADQHGISHLLEHMAFKGTRSRSALQIAETIERVGGELNAATSTETTSFYARVLKNDVPLAIDLLADILNDSVIDPDELQREKHVIQQEIGAAQDSPEDVVFDEYLSATFADQALGRPIMGTPESVNGFDADGLHGYLQDHYHGSNMVLSAAGAVDHDAVVTQAEKLLSRMPSEAVGEPEAGHYSGGESRVERPLQEAQIVLGFEGRAYQAKDYYASSVLSTLLGGGMSSRLFQQVREKRGLCYSIYAFHWAFSDTGTFGVHAATEAGDVPELMSVLGEELLRCADTISQEELDRARAQIGASLLMALESPGARAGQIARQQLLFGRLVSNEELMDRLAALTVQRLRDLAGDLFTSAPPTIAAIGPIDGLPSRQAMGEMLRAQAG